MKRAPASLWILLIFLGFASFLKATLPQTVIGSWTAATSLTQARSSASAVLLPDGRILIAGGDNGSGPIASAELFGTDGTVTSAGTMKSARSRHFAVVLSDGRVLVGGGLTSGGGTTNTAEIYDPSNNSWTAINPLTQARANATAAVLQDGRVLIVGGDNSGTPTNSVEIYDPTSGNFSFVGALSSPRTQHAMAVLQDGRVLIVGGTDGTNPLASSDIFDPASGNVTAGPNLTTARYAHSATTLLNGQVVVIGGATTGDNGTTDLASVELFDPSAGAFTTASASLTTAREGHQAFLLPKNNSVLIVGGTSNGAVVAASELFTPQVSATDGSWTYATAPTGSNITPRSAASGPAMQQDGLLLAAGGNDASGNALASTELYAFPTVKTDQSDYPPGTIVNITGSGFNAGETVTITLVESPLIDTHGPYTITADSNGNITDSSFTTDSHDVNVRFWLSAVGGQSGLQAQNTFTDANDNTSTTVSCTSTTLLVGVSTNCTATVKDTGGNNGSPTGSVNWSVSPVDGTFGSTPCTLTAGASGTSTCSSSFSATAGGTPTITAAYPGGGSGNTQWKTSNGTLGVTITKRSTTTAVSVSPTSVPVGQPSTATVTVTDTDTGTQSNPTGTLTLTSSDSGDVFGSCTLTASGGNAAKCTVSVTPSKIGTSPHTITATYAGDTAHATSNGSTSLTVSQASTTTAVGSSTNPSSFGQSVTFTATVSITGAGTPTGSVEFFDGTTSLGTGTLSGTAPFSSTLATSTLTVGNHSITAKYTGDTNFSASTSSAVSQVVNLVNTTTTVMWSTAAPVFGQSVTFTAKIAPASGSTVPTGTVQFVVDGSNFGSGVSVASCAPNPDACATSISTSTLSVGLHTVTANYSGDSNYSTSSGSQAETVSAASTTTALASSANPSVFGQSVTFTATVTVNSPGTGTVPSGESVTFKDGATSIGTGTTNASGIATLTSSTLTVATHSITAVYAGDTNFATSTSTAVSQVVTKANTTTTITNDLSTPTVVGQSYSVSVSVAITAPGAGTIPNTDTVTVSDGFATCTVTLTSASGFCNLISLTPGTKTIAATYNGDANFSSSVSAGTSHTVSKASTTTTISSNTPNPSAVGQGVTISYSVAVTAPGTGTPTGNVTVSDGSGDSCTASAAAGTCQITFNTAGSFTLTATYSGDSNFNGSASAGTNQTVNPKLVITTPAFTTVTGVCSPQIIAQTQNNNGSGSNGARTLNLSGAATGKFYSDAACTNQISSIGILASSSTATFYYTDTAQEDSTITVASNGLTSASQTETFTGLRFGTNAFTVALGQCSPAFTIQSGPPSGMPVSPTQNVMVSLSSTSANGKFFSDSTCGIQITTALIGPGIDGGHDTPAIYYKDATGGTPTLTASAGTALTTQAETVTKLTPTFTVPASQSITVGTTSITLSGTIAAATFFPTSGETVNITINGVTTPATIGANGAFSASIDTHAIPASATAYTITYNYAGDSNFNSATNTATTLTVNKGSTSTALVSSTNPSVFTQQVTFTATVSLTSGSGVPTGTVQFMDGASALGSPVALTNNSGTFSAQLQTSSLSVATHTITVVYSGDGNFTGSTSNAVSQVVNNPATTTAVSSSSPFVSGVPTSSYGTSVAFTATVTSGAGTPTGSVIFYDGACGVNPLAGPINLDGSGKASFNTANLSAGTQTISACYTHTGIFLDSSGTVIQQVNQATPTVTFTGAPVSAYYTSQFMVTATANSTATVTITASGACTISGTTVTMISGLGICSLQASWPADTNYTSASLMQSTNALPAPVTVTVPNSTVTYDGSLHAVTPSFSAAVNSFTVAYTGISPTIYATSATAPTEPGSYDVLATVTDPNYTGSGDGTLTINKEDPALNLVLLSGMPDQTSYGTRVFFELTTATSPCPTGQVDFYIDGDSTSSSTVPLSDSPCTHQPIEFSTATLTPGTHNVTAVYSGDAHYLNQTSAAVSHSVVADTTTVTLATSAMEVFVGDSVTLTATLTPYKSLDTAAATPTGTVQFYDNGTTLLDEQPVVANGSSFTATSVFSSLAAGPHSITATYVSANGDFVGSSSPVQLETVDKIAPTIHWQNPGDIVYGTKLSSTQLNATATDEHNGGIPISGIFTYTPPADTVLAIGSRNLSVTFTPGDSATYTSQTMTVTVNVTPATLTVTADDASRNYGADNPTFTFQYSGFVNNETSTIVTTPPTCSSTANSSSNIGTYDITCSGAVAPNYTVMYVNGKLTVKAAPLTISANSVNKTYGLTLTFLGTEFGTSGLLNSDTVTSVTLTSAGAVATATVTSPGPNYPIMPSGAVGSGLDNYTITYVNGTLCVKPAPLTVTANNTSKTYGSTLTFAGTEFQITSGTLYNSDTLTSVMLTSVGAAATATVAGSPYDIVPSAAVGTGLGNYSIYYKNGQLTVNRAHLTVTADPQSRFYGDPNPAFTATITGFVNGEMFGTSGVTGAAYCTTIATASSPASPPTYPITCTVGSLMSENYDFPSGNFVPGALTVTQRPITVTPDAGQSKIYGNSDPTLTYKVSLGNLVNSDMFTGMLSRVTGENVGTYSITQGSLTAGSNYALTFTAGVTFSITVRPITVTPYANQSKVYGYSDPMFTYSISSGNLVAGDGFTGALSRVAGENVGTYAITQGSLTAGSNYALSVTPGVNFSITARPITVTANPQGIIFGQVDPTPLTYSIAGSLATGDSFSGSLTRMAGEDVGVYPITQGTLALSSNYSLTFAASSLTISPANTSILSQNFVSSLNPSNYGQSVTFTATVTPQYSGTPTGAVSFYNAASGANCASLGSSSLIDAEMLVNGQVSISTATLPPGNPLMILACYAPDTSNFLASAGTFAQTVLPAPVIGINPSSLSFGNQQAGTTSSPATITISNSGTAPLVFSSGGIGITGTNASYFSFVTPSNGTDCRNVGSSGVAVSGSCNLAIVFKPADTGVETATLNLTDNDRSQTATSQQSVPITGAGTSSINSVSGLFSYAIFATANGCGTLTLSGNSSVDSFDSTIAGGYSASHANNGGNVGTNGNINLNGSNVAVYGTASVPNTKTGNCSTSNATGLTINGNAAMPAVVQLTQPVVYASPTMPTPLPPTTNQSISGSCGTIAGCTSNGSKNVNLAPGQYGSLSITGGTTVHVTAGTYNVNSLTLSGNSMLVVDSGPVVINIAGTGLNSGASALDLSGGTMSNMSGIPNNLQLYYGGSRSVKLSGGTGAFAVVYAPNAPITISGGSHFYGAIVGSTIAISGGVAVHYDRSSPAIAAGSYVWFNSAALNVQNLPSNTNAKLFVTNASITFNSTASQCTGTFNFPTTGQCTLPVPSAVVTFSPTATSASTSWDSTNNRWSALVPTNGSTTIQTHAFLDGLAYLVPSGGFPAGIQNVTWSAAFETDYVPASPKPGISFQWQWAAAVYTTFSTTYSSGTTNNVLGVSPVDGAAAAGTPTAFEQYLTSGGSGAGATNYTGFYVGTAGVVPTIAPASIAPSSLNFGSVSVSAGVPVSLAVALSNNQSGPLTLNSGTPIAISGTNAADFSQTSNCPAPGGTLAGGGGSCTITIIFKPSVQGVEKAKLSVYDSANNSPQTVYLTGTGTTP